MQLKCKKNEGVGVIENDDVNGDEEMRMERILIWK